MNFIITFVTVNDIVPRSGSNQVVVRVAENLISNIGTGQRHLLNLSNIPRCAIGKEN